MKEKCVEDVQRKSQTTLIQQDNAEPHISPTDSEFMSAGSTYGRDIRLKCQPPNSPDINVLDLGSPDPFNPCSIKKMP